MAEEQETRTVERSDVEVTGETVERAAEAQTNEAKIAWALVVVAAVLTMFFPILSVLLAALAAYLARRVDAQTPLIAAAALFFIALLVLLFEGTGGFLGKGDLFNA